MRRDTLHGVSAHAYLKVSATIPRLHTAVKSLVPEGIPGMEFVVAVQLSHRSPISRVRFIMIAMAKALQ